VYSRESSGGRRNRPIDDVLKRGNYDLLACRGTDIESVNEIFRSSVR
jgi:hypothetical protein